MVGEDATLVIPLLRREVAERKKCPVETINMPLSIWKELFWIDPMGDIYKIAFAAIAQ